MLLPKRSKGTIARSNIIRTYSGSVYVSSSYGSPEVGNDLVNHKQALTSNAQAFAEYIDGDGLCNDFGCNKRIDTLERLLYDAINIVWQEEGRRW
jgi:hypothetical protein